MRPEIKLEKLTSLPFVLVLIGLLLMTSILFSLQAIPKNSLIVQLWYMLVLVLVILSLSISVKRRISGALKQTRSRRRSHFKNRTDIRTVSDIHKVSQILRIELEKIGWTIPNRVSLHSTQLEKGNAGKWGSIVFHIGIIVTAIGISVAILLGYQSIFVLNEGEDFKFGDGKMKILVSGILASDPVLPGTSIKLNRLDAEHKFGTGTTIASHLIINGQNEHVLYSGNAIKVDGYSLNQGKWGYSVGVTVHKFGNNLFGGWIKLKKAENNNTQTQEDYIFLDDGSRLDLQLRVSDGGDRLRVKNSLDGNVKFTGALIPGQSINIDEYSLTFQGVRLWSQIELGYDPGFVFTLVGFILIATGACLRAAYFRKIIVISLAKEKEFSILAISGWAEKYRSSYQQDLDTLLNRIREQVDTEYHWLNNENKNAYIMEKAS